MENGLNSQPVVACQSAEVCAVCLDRILGKKTLKCSHSFCSDCIESSFKRKPACPVCNTFYGEHTGNQPVGTMTVTRSWQCLPGYDRCGCIVIKYSFPAGLQGVSYTHTHKHTYIHMLVKEVRCYWLTLKEVVTRRIPDFLFKMLVWFGIWPLGGTLV